MQKRQKKIRPRWGGSCYNRSIEKREGCCLAEFCVDCWNRIHHTHYDETELWLETDLCEECGEVKGCIISLQRKPLVIQLCSELIRWFRSKMKGPWSP